MRFWFTAIILCKTAAATIAWKPLWDGKSLNGWHNRGKDAWTIEKETQASAPALHGKHSSASDDYSMLYTDKSYDFFTLRVVYKMLEGNSGVYVKARELEKTPFVAGIQVDLDAVNLLSLYCTSCGAGVYSPPADIKAKISKDGYNTLLVTAKGDNLFTSINGAEMPAWNFKGNQHVLPSGPIGLQLHDARLDEAWFREVSIMEGCTDKASPRYDKEAENPRLFVIHNASLCEAPSVLAKVGPTGVAGAPVRFLPGHLRVDAVGPYRLEVSDPAGRVHARWLGDGPGDFLSPALAANRIWIATLRDCRGLRTARGAMMSP